MEKSELQTIKKCKKGQLEEFGYLYNLYVKKIYSFVFYRVNSKEVTEDLTSQIFIKALEKINKFSIDAGASFQAWLYTIARNTVIDYYRRQKDVKNIDDVFGLSFSNYEEKKYDQKDSLKKIKNFLENFNQEQREIIIMRIWDGLSYAEIAKITGKKVGALKMIVSRFLKKIRSNPEMQMSIIVIYLVFTQK